MENCTKCSNGSSPSLILQPLSHDSTHGFDWVVDKTVEHYAFKFEQIRQATVKQVFIWCSNYALAAAVFYLVTIFVLKHWMKNRPPLQLKNALFYWNGALGIFSILGSIRATPALVDALSRENGFYHSICVPQGISQVNLFWSMLFVLSKVVEFGDTVFIVLLKKPLQKIQWYHHVATLFVTWSVSPFMEPINRYFITLNYLVHALMYPYFAMMTRGVKIPRWIAITITSLQFSQMIIGLVANVASFYMIQKGHDCYREPYSIYVFAGLYGSFVLLFGDLLYKSFKKTMHKKTE